MFNILEIARQNRATFYDFSTGKQLSTWRCNLIKLVATICLAWLFSNLSKDFLNAVITIYSILIGFSFNILFYLLSINRLPAPKESLEKELKIDKVNKLRDELFYNVSYFNITSILVIVIALVFFLFDSRLPHFLSGITDIEFLKPLTTPFEADLIHVRKFLLLIYRIFLYLLLVESLYTFVRTIGRVSFYFREKIKL